MERSIESMLGCAETRKDLRVMVTIVTPVIAAVAAHVFAECEVPILYDIEGEGTASKEWMQLLRLGSSEKKILISVLPKEQAYEMSEKLGRCLPLKKAGTGIVFTMPLDGMHDYSQTQKDDAGHQPEKMEYSMVAAIAKKGSSEEVMDAARTVGASGGTVVHASKITSEKILNLWGLSEEGDREIILILSTAEKKSGLMAAIEARCWKTEAQARTFASPVDRVEGLDYYLN